MTNQKIASLNEAADNTAMLTLGLVFPGCCTLHVVEQFPCSCRAMAVYLESRESLDLRGTR